MSSLRQLLNPEKVQQCINKAPKKSIPATPVEDMESASIGDSVEPDDDAPLHDDKIDELAHAPHENCPDSLDCLPDTDGRPQHTLPIILRCAILGSSKRRLTIREIYTEMENKYPFYKTAGPAWKQSVRHHLSLNRLFERQAKPVTDPGFGSYWTVNLSAPPGTKRPRKRGRGNKTAAATAEECDDPARKRPRPEVDESVKDTGLGVNVGTVYTSNGYPGQSSYRLHSVYSPSAYSPFLEDKSRIPKSSFNGGDSAPNPVYTTQVRRVTGRRGDDEDGVRPHVYEPRSPSPVPSPIGRSPSSVSYDATHEAERLLEENRELRRQSVLYSSKLARMAGDLSEAHAEIARLRARNEILERHCDGRG